MEHEKDHIWLNLAAKKLQDFKVFLQKRSFFAAKLSVIMHIYPCNYPQKSFLFQVKS